MKLTPDQVKSFFHDDITLANTDGMDFIDSKLKILDNDSSNYTLVIRVNGQLLMGKMMIYGSNESGYEFPSRFDGLEMKPCEQLTKITKYWSWI